MGLFAVTINLADLLGPYSVAGSTTNQDMRSRHAATMGVAMRSRTVGRCRSGQACRRRSPGCHSIHKGRHHAESHLVQLLRRSVKRRKPTTRWSDRRHERRGYSGRVARLMERLMRGCRMNEIARQVRTISILQHGPRGGIRTCDTRFYRALPFVHRRPHRAVHGGNRRWLSISVRIRPGGVRPGSCHGCCQQWVKGRARPTFLRARSLVRPWRPSFVISACSS